MARRRWNEDEGYDGQPRHRECPCGCGELADECAGPSPRPLGSITVRTPAPNPYRRTP